MTAVAIADFSGMMPLRDPILLPDNYSQYAKNTWLYRGAIRGYRDADSVYSIEHPLTTKQIYRIPLTDALEDWGNSLWLEFPDPYMKVIRNPTVGDTYNRYYFFPSVDFVDDGTGWLSVPFYAPKKKPPKPKPKPPPKPIEAEQPTADPVPQQPLEDTDQ